MPGDPPAAIVDRERADEAIPALRSAGVYDPTRRIEPVGGGRLAIPVTAPRPLDAVEGYERGLATERRPRTLADHLAARGWSDDELDAVPASYARIGDIVVVTGDLPHRPGAVGRALLELHGDAAAVVRLEGIAGERRRPSVTHVAGATRTETVHREHGIAYGLDLREVMFSPGNQHERARMRTVVDRGERVLDLCAGIGYFALPMADGGARVTAVERAPAAFRWLSRNASSNGLDARVTPVPGDCRACPASADRAVIGHLPVHDCRGDPTAAGGGYLDAAVRAVDAGWLHVHGIAWAGEHARAGRALVDRLERRGATVAAWTAARVKGVAPRTDHVVVDVRIERR